MKDVITYRTNDLDNLKKMAKIRNVSLSTITGEIIREYVHEKMILKNLTTIKNGRKFISAAFNHLDPSVFEKIETIGATEFCRSAKMSMNNFSLDNVLRYIKEWIQSNNFKLSEFDENNRIRWICETNMGKNYNQICTGHIV